MKKINLTVSYEEEKVKALRWYLEQKGTKLEEELVKAVDTLFNKNVPANVRNYICKDEDAPPAAEAPKPRHTGIWDSMWICTPRTSSLREARTAQ